MMLNKAVLTKEPISLSGYHRPVCIYNKEKPQHSIINCEYVQLKQVLEYLALHQSGIDLLIIDNLGKMITPGNRCDQVWEHLYSGIKCSKMAIENQIFYIDEWRMWFVYGFLDTRIFGFATSFEAERQWENKNSDVLTSIKPYTECHFQKQFNFEVKLHIYRTTENEKEGYEQLKLELFNSSSNIKPVINGLYKYSKSLLREHNMPLNFHSLYKDEDLNSFFDNKIWNIYLTDLKVDQYILKQLRNLINRSNYLTSQLYENIP